jgi:ferrous-iron efflux pump FieF
MPTAAGHGTLMRRAAWAAVATAAFLVALKVVAYFATNSVAMLSSLADSGLDLFASSLNLVAIGSALTPADAEHRFGHGKAEPLAGLAQGAFIAGSAIFLVVAAIGRLIAPRPIDQGGLGVGVMCVSIVLTFVLVAYQRRVVAKTGSLAIGADRAHYTSDIVVNAGVILAIVLASWFAMSLADPVIGLGVACVLAWSAWHVFRLSYDQLMDRELPDGERDRIKAVVMRHADVRNLHDLRTRAAGVSTFIQLHIELDPEISLMRAHEVSDEVEADICRAYPNAEVIIHQDPAGVEMPPELAKT